MTASPFEPLKRWAAWMDVMGLASSTKQQYRRNVVNFLADTMLDPFEVTEDDVVAFLAKIPAAGSMRGMYLRSLRSFYGWAAGRSGIPDPTARLKVPKKKYGNAPSLSPDELERFLTAVEPLDPRARPTFELAFATGARVGALARLTAEDVTAGKVTFVYDKGRGGGKTRSVPIGPRAQRAIFQLLALKDYLPPRVTAKPDTLVGVGPDRIRAWARKGGAAAGLEVWPHLIRHTFATRLAEDPKMDLRTWVELMGHEDASLFRRYAAVSDDRLTAAVEAL